MARIFFTCLAVWLLAASAQADNVWRERLAFDDPEWRPLVSVGYRMQLVREPTQEGVKRELGHGFGLEALFPLLSSGRRESRTRLSIALGFGADYGEAQREGARGSDGSRDVWREYSAWFHGALALVLRVRLTPHWAFVSSLAWLPGVRWARFERASFRSSGSGFTTFVPAHYYAENPDVFPNLTHGRAAFSLVYRGARLGLFFGATRRDNVASWRRGPELELGMQMGVGW